MAYQFSSVGTSVIPYQLHSSTGRVNGQIRFAGDGNFVDTSLAYLVLILRTSVISVPDVISIIILFQLLFYSETNNNIFKAIIRCQFRNSYKF